MRLREIMSDDEKGDIWWDHTMSGITMNRIMQRIWKVKYPGVRLYATGQGDGQVTWSTEKNMARSFAHPILKDPNGFVLETMGAEASIEYGAMIYINYASSGQYKGVITNFLRDVFQILQNKYEKEVRASYTDEHDLEWVINLTSRDGSDGAWQHIADVLGASLMQNAHH